MCGSSGTLSRNLSSFLLKQYSFLYVVQSLDVLGCVSVYTGNNALPTSPSIPLFDLPSIVVLLQHLPLRPFPYLGSAHQVFNLRVLRSCASSMLNTPLTSFLLITSLHLSFSLPIFRCPPTSMFSLLHLLQSFCRHGLTISVLLLVLSHLLVQHVLLNVARCRWSFIDLCAF